MTQIRHSYTIMGATGHVGSVVAERLLKTGAQCAGSDGIANA
jgi:nucleoside-diphosphate-sugar epimerase